VLKIKTIIQEKSRYFTHKIKG